MCNIMPSGGFHNKILWPSTTVTLLLMKNVLQMQVKNVLIPEELTAASASAADGVIHKKLEESGTCFRNYNPSNIKEKMEDVMKIETNSLKYYDLLLKCINKTIENDTKQQGGGFFSMLLSTLGANPLENLLSRRGLILLMK